LYSATGGNNLFSLLVKRAVELTSSKGSPTQVLLVQPGLVGARWVLPPPRGLLGQDSARLASLFPLADFLRPRLAADLPLEAPLRCLAFAHSSRLLSELLSGKRDLFLTVRPLEETAKSRVRDAIVGRELSQRLIRRSAPEQILVGDELA
jgi:hypothetical protein